MSQTSEVQGHVTAILAAATTAIGIKVIAEPERYHQDSLGRKLADDICQEVRIAAGAEDYSDLNP